MDRIAKAAKTSKERVYTYFRSKEELYAAVAADQLQEVMDSTELDPADLPGYVGELFDFYAEHPDMLRLVGWSRLEPNEALVGLGEAGAASLRHQARRDRARAARRACSTTRSSRSTCSCCWCT